MLNKFCNKQLSRAISVLLSLCLMLTGAIVMGTIASAEENIITNGGFETGDHTGWNNGANAEIVSNEHHSGSHSLRLVCRNWASYSQSFSVIPEAKYRISWYMKSSDPGVGLTVKVLLPSDATHIQKWKNGETDWELCEIEFTAPKNTTELKLLFTEDSDVVRYLDDIVVKQLKEFVPAYVGCGGTEIDGIDFVLAKKVFRKFESLNLSFIRDEIDGLVTYLNKHFGKANMNECKEYLQLLKRLM